MSIWAIGRTGERQRAFIETTDPELVILHMEPGEVIAPVSRAQMEGGVILRGNMECESAPET